MLVRISRGNSADLTSSMLRFQGRAMTLLPHDRVRQITRVVKYAVYGIVMILLARLFWLIFAPSPVPSEVPTIIPSGRTVRVASVATATNPFALPKDVVEVVPEQTDVLADTSLNLKLHGTTVDGDNSTAIIDVPNGTGQTVFRTGDTITNGVTLDDILPAEVILLRGGIREALRFQPLGNGQSARQPRPNTAPSRPAPTVQNVPRGTPPTRLNRQGNVVAAPTASFSIQKLLSVRRRTMADGSAGLFLYPGFDREAFASAGLVAGDLLVSINGTPPPENIRQLFELSRRFAPNTPITIVVEREGVPRTLRVDTSALAVEPEEDDDD